MCYTWLQIILLRQADLSAEMAHPAGEHGALLKHHEQQSARLMVVIQW